MVKSDKERQVPHGLQSFAVTCWQDMMRKLRFEINEFERTRGVDGGNAERGYRALNVAWTAWHLHDWFFEGRMDAGDEFLAVVVPAFPEKKFNEARRPERLRSFGKALTEKYWALRVCRTIATAGKHGKAESWPEYDLITGPVRPVVIGHSISYEDVRIQFDGAFYEARDVFLRALGNWEDFFRTIGWSYPGSSIFMPDVPAS